MRVLVNDAPNPIAQAGLPPTWQPAPLGFSLAKLGIQTTEGNKVMHLLILDGPTGRQAFAFDTDAFRQLAEKIIEQTSGLTIASDIPANGQGQWPPA